MHPESRARSSPPHSTAVSASRVDRADAGPRPVILQPTDHSAAAGHRTFWLWVMCLTGVDYFSRLAYQPSIAFEAAGVLAPVATVVLVLVTLFGALLVYSRVAQCSPNGMGSISILERLVHGWTGKAMVLALLGFAATDFVITKTLSAADAAVHLIDNPMWQYAPAFVLQWSPDQQRMALTMTLLVLLGGTFVRGFKEAIGLAVVIVAVYLVLNLLVIGSGLAYLAVHPEFLTRWYTHLVEGDWHLKDSPLAGHDGWTIALLSLILFPKLALGLSGFEAGVAVMPLIKGDPATIPTGPPGEFATRESCWLPPPRSCRSSCWLPQS